MVHQQFELQVLKLDEDMKKLALQLKNESSLLIFGRGVNYATALEAALKVSALPLCSVTFCTTLGMR